MSLNRLLDEYEASLAPPPVTKAFLGAFIDGTFQTTVPTDPSLTYIRYLDGTPTKVKHRNRVNLDSGNQNIPLEIGMERGFLSILNLDEGQSGAVYQSNPNIGNGFSIHALPSKVTPVETDEFPEADSQDNYSHKRVTLENLRYFTNGFLFSPSALITIDDDATETSLLDGVVSLPGVLLGFSGTVVVVTELWGVISTAAIPGNLEIRAYLESDVIADTGAIALTALLTDTAWRIVLYAVPIYSAFPTGGMRAWGFLEIFDTLTGSKYPMNSGISAVGSSDLSDGANVDVTAQFDSAVVGNTLYVTGGRLQTPPETTF